jgi:hypothetical protein
MLMTSFQFSMDISVHEDSRTVAFYLHQSAQQVLLQKNKRNEKVVFSEFNDKPSSREQDPAQYPKCFTIFLILLREECPSHYIHLPIPSFKYH